MRFLINSGGGVDFVGLNIPISEAKKRVNFSQKFLIDININELIQMNHESGLFNRSDIVLRSLVAKSILGRKDSAVTSQDCFLLSSCKKMQITRANRDTTERFSELLRSFSENGLDTKKYPVPVDSLGRIIDGAHRVALALKCKKESLVCEVMPFEREIYYGRQWFKENGFDPFLLELLDDEYHNVSRNVNFKYE